MFYSRFGILLVFETGSFYNMMKYIKYIFGFVVLCSQVSAMDKVNVGPTIGVTGQQGHFSYHTITEKDIPEVSRLASECKYTEGFPDLNTWTGNLVKRQNGGNSYSALILSDAGKPVGVLGLGRMPVVNYEPKFVDIIETYVEFGVTKFVNPEAADKYAKENIVQIQNKGLAILLPILPESLGDEKRVSALKIGVDVVRFLKGSTRLPIEGTIPEYLIGLYHPTDPLLPLLESAGFTILKKKGFEGFYDKERVMAYLKL